jgi:hypothetical protein
MSKYQLTDFASAELARMHPDNQSVVVRVLDILGEDHSLRDSSKFDLNLPPEQGRTIWGIRMGRVWIAFIEENDSGLSIIHLTMLSRFRYDD